MAPRPRDSGFFCACSTGDFNAMQKSANASVTCMIFDAIYALIYFLAMIANFVEHDARAVCWADSGYAGHPRYQIYAWIAGLTTVLCVWGIFLHARLVCCIPPEQRTKALYKKLYYFLCLQIFWMGFSLVLENLTPQVQQEEIPEECRASTEDAYSAKRREAVNIFMLIFWVVWLAVRTAGSYYAFVLFSVEGALEESGGGDGVQPVRRTEFRMQELGAGSHVVGAPVNGGFNPQMVSTGQIQAGGTQVSTSVPPGSLEGPKPDAENPGAKWEQP